MDKTVLQRFIGQQLLYFSAGRRCCQEFACTFRPVEQRLFISSAHTLGLRSQLILNHGQTCIKVFKRTCKHHLEEPKCLALSHSSVMNLHTFLEGMESDNNHMLEYYNRFHLRIKVPPINISFGSRSHGIIRSIRKNQGTPLWNSALLVYQRDIIDFIIDNRVTIFDGNTSLDKSVFFPLIIMKNFEDVRLICIEKENILATYNCERLAENVGESVGKSVGIHLRQTNSLSSVTNVFYTTAEFFLRSLMNSRKVNNITHFVVNDVDFHEPYNDILLYELKRLLALDAKLRIILFSNNPLPLINFFGEGKKFCKEPTIQNTNTNIYYLEDIQIKIGLENVNSGSEIYKKQRQMFRNKNIRHLELDKCLEAYEQLGTDGALRPFLYAINYEMVPVDYQHTMTGKTAVFIAARLGKPKHLRLLLFMGANPSITNESHENAMTAAALYQNTECVNILQNFNLNKYVLKSDKPQFVNSKVILDLIPLIFSNATFLPGNILVILPTYYHLVKLNYMLLRNYLVGKLQDFSIFLLHEDMDKDYLHSLVKAPNDSIKVVLATEIVESLSLPVSFHYLIDTACQVRSIYDGASNSAEDRYEWASKECLKRRLSVLEGGTANAARKYCFRLISSDGFHKLNEFRRPSMLTTQLDKICLTVKFLCPNSSITEYLSSMIAPPPLISVHQTIQFLQKIDVLDEAGNVTWLGCRLIDIPLPCQLGRTLIFGILLKCLDPLLTIVGSLVIADPLSIPFSEEIDPQWKNFYIYIQNCIKSERVRLAADQFSDHFVSVRLFQQWQGRLKNETLPLYLTDEYEFLLNGLMEQLNRKRMLIVSALRAANLIHTYGQLNIHDVNIKSGCWPMVKAALVGGLYPNLCAIDNNGKSLKSAHTEHVYLHAVSVLRNFFEPIQQTAQRVGTSWIVCTKQKNNIKYATAVLSLSVAMFCGSSSLGLNYTAELQEPSDDDKIHYFIDEWIWLLVSKSDFDLILKTRHTFFQIYNYFLRNCSELEKWRNDTILTKHLQLLETLTKIFEDEEAIIGFPKCLKTDFRPVNLPNLYLLSVNSHFTWQAPNERAAGPIKRHFFLLHTGQNAAQFYKNPKLNHKDIIGKFVKPIESPSRQIYVILYSTKYHALLSISRVKLNKDELVFKEYFRNRISVPEVLQYCTHSNVSPPSFDGQLASELIEKTLGNLLMNLFAYRHHWVHK